MHKRYHCVRGHVWEAVVDGDAVANLDAIACPACGEVATAVPSSSSIPVEDQPTGPELLTVPHEGAAAPSPSSRALRSSRNWAAAAWASSTRPGRSRLNRLVALKMILAGARRPARRNWPASAPRPRRSPACSTPTSSRSTRSASTTACPSSRWSTCEGGSLAETARRHAAGRRGGRPSWSRRWPGPCTTPTSRASSTATSSRPTSCSTADGTPKITDFGLAKQLDGDGGLTPRPARSWARPATWPRSRPRGRAASDRRRPPTSTPWARSSTSADRPAAVPGGHGRWTPSSRCVRAGAGAAAAAAAAAAARPGDDLPEVPGEGARPALRQRRGPGRRPGALPRRRADPGPADRPAGPGRQVGPAAAGLAGLLAAPAAGRRSWYGPDGPFCRAVARGAAGPGQRAAPTGEGARASGERARASGAAAAAGVGGFPALSLAKRLEPKGEALAQVELDAVWELASTDRERVRERFFEIGLASAGHAARLENRPGRRRRRPGSTRNDKSGWSRC